MSQKFKKRQFPARSNQQVARRKTNGINVSERKIKLGAAKLGLKPLTAYVASPGSFVASGEKVLANPPDYQSKSRMKKVEAGLKQFSRYVPESQFATLSALVTRLRDGDDCLQAFAAQNAISGEVAELSSVPPSAPHKSEISLSQYEEAVASAAAINIAYSTLLTEHNKVLVELSEVKSGCNELQMSHAALSAEYRAAIGRSAKQQLELARLATELQSAQIAESPYSFDRIEEMKHAEERLRELVNARGWRGVLIRIASGNAKDDFQN